jgi:hypothetical protein
MEEQGGVEKEHSTKIALNAPSFIPSERRTLFLHSKRV